MAKSVSTAYLETYLDEIEVASVQAFTANSRMFEAVKKVLLMGIYHNGTLRKGEKPDPTINFALASLLRPGEILKTNEELGAELRANAKAVELIEMGFNELAKLKAEEEREVKELNPAR